MASNPIPFNLNWVQERAKCSLPNIFKQLEIGAGEDIKTLEALFPGDTARWGLVQGKNHFSVTLVLDPIRPFITDAIDFELEKDEIVIKNGERTLFKARITLNHAGQCRLKTEDDGPELELWQVRRMALEKLFFGPRS